MTRGLLFTGGALVPLMGFVLFTSELPQDVFLGPASNRFDTHMALDASIGLTAFIGSALGFRLLSGRRIIGALRLLALGALFGTGARGLLIPLMQAVGFLVAVLLMIMSAAAIALIGIQVLSNPVRDGI